MRRKRVIYFNDARHYYLFVFEPPITMADAWRPVDEVAGTSVDTFCYGVERGDGLFYPSRVGIRFAADMKQFEQAAYWRVWHNMQSLIDRGLDPLTVLIDRAHEKGMDFIASLRMTGYGDMSAEHRLENGGGGLAHEEVRDHQFAVLEELAREYDTDGVELDLALPGGGPRVLRSEDVKTTTPVLTEYVAKISEMVRNRPGEPGQVGVRVLPTEEMNLDQGLDVRTWLRDGLIDFAVPLRYAYMILDPDMPIDWLIEAATAADASVYPVLQPYIANDMTSSRSKQASWANPEHMRAAAANYYDRGADGMYTWFMRWPLGNAERQTLTELGDAELMMEGDKHYVVARNVAQGESHYPCELPIEIPAADAGTRHPIRFYVADDVEDSRQRIGRMALRVSIMDLVWDDRIDILLNGQSLRNEHCERSPSWDVAPYVGQWLEFHLKDIVPRHGDNLLEVVLEGRAEGLVSPLKVEEVELIVEYGPFPPALRQE